MKKTFRSLLLTLGLGLQFTAVLQAGEPPVSVDREANSTVQPALAPVFCRLQLNDDQQLLGYIVAENDSAVTLRLKAGGRLTVDRSSIAQIERDIPLSQSPQDEAPFSDPNRTRYLFAPSALMLKKGEATFSQKELFFTSFGIGLSDHVSLIAGAAIPFWFMNEGDGGFNLELGLKGGGSLQKNLHLAGGVETFLVPGSKLMIGLPFVTTTVGNADRQLSFGASMPFAFSGDESEFGNLYWFALSGAWRVSRHVSLVSDNWFFQLPQLAEESNVFSLALRLLNKRMSGDIGLFFNRQMPFPMPWLDLTFRFRGI
jgi:hypothetical protein